MTETDSKRWSFKTVSHKDLLTINNNESVSFGSNVSQTKRKSLRTRDFLMFFARNCGLHLEHFFENKYKE